MDLMTIVAVGLLWLLAAVLAIILFAAIFFNMKVGMRFRDDLANRIHDLRLGKMLNALGINIDSYLHSEPVVDIENQINRCRQCANTDECDEKLNGNAIKPDEIAFCNNEKSLQEIVGKTSGSVVNP